MYVSILLLRSAIGRDRFWTLGMLGNVCASWLDGQRQPWRIS